MSAAKGDYLRTAKELSDSSSKELVSRIGQHYFDELTGAGIQEVDALAMLLWCEDERMHEWRQVVAKIRAEGRGNS